MSSVLRIGSRCAQKCQKGPTIKSNVRIKAIRFICHIDEILSSENTCKLKFILTGKLNKWRHPEPLDIWG